MELIHGSCLLSSRVGVVPWTFVSGAPTTHPPSTHFIDILHVPWPFHVPCQLPCTPAPLAISSRTTQSGMLVLRRALRSVFVVAVDEHFGSATWCAARETTTSSRRTYGAVRTPLFACSCTQPPPCTLLDPPLVRAGTRPEHAQIRQIASSGGKLGTATRAGRWSRCEVDARPQ